MIHQCEKCGIYTTGDFYKIYPKPDTSFSPKPKIMCPECGKKYIDDKIADIIQTHFKKHHGVLGHDYNGVKYVNFQDGTHMVLDEYREEFRERLIPYLTGLYSWNDYTE